MPTPAPNAGSAYLRFIPRNEMDIAVVGVGVALMLNDSLTTCRSARIALGAVGPTPLFAAEASEFLVGRSLLSADLDQAARWPSRRRSRSATCAATPTIAGIWSAYWSSERSGSPAHARREVKAMPKKIHVQATINGKPTEFLCEPRQSLLEVLRDELRLTGSKEGCNNGNCGACNVILEGRLVNSCLVLGAEVAGQGGDDDRGGRASDRGSIRCSKNSSNTRPCNAASARRASSSPPRRSWRPTRIPAKNRSGTGWPATCAAAPATTRSSAPSSTPPGTRGQDRSQESGINS